MQSAMVMYAEDLIVDYLSDELIINPFPLPMDNILEYLYVLNNKKGVKYMSENLERNLRRWGDSKSRLIEMEIEQRKPYGLLYQQEQVANIISDESYAKVEVEKEIYRLIGKSAVAGISQSASLKDMLDKLKR